MIICTLLNRRRIGPAVWLAVIVLLGAYSIPAHAEIGPITSLNVGTNEIEPNEVLVRWKNSDSINRYAVENVDEALAILQVNPQVEQVERNASRHVSVVSTPDDPYYDLQYHLDQSSDDDIDANKAWQTTTGSRDVVIAVIDTGVDIHHEDLEDNIWTNPGEIAGNGIDDDSNGYIDDVNGWDFVENDNDPTPIPTSLSYSTVMVVHGTHVSGILGAVGNNGIGVTGVNWNVTIMPIRVFTEFGDSTAGDLVTAVDYARENGADVINMSYGGGSPSTFEEESIHAAYEAGILSIAAAGNESIDLNDLKQYPACYDEVFGVASLTASDEMSSFSNYGDDCVDASAAGSNIMSAYYYNPDWYLYDQYNYLSGTSMATPVVSGVAGLVHSVRPDISPENLRKILRQSADDLNDNRLGQGRINANQAVRRAQSLNNPTKPIIKAYTNSNKKQSIQANTRTNTRQPFFTWKKPASTYAISGYYVYWGTQKKNPVAKGVYRTKAKFRSTKKIRGNDKKYYLRIRTQDNEGNISKVANFTYRIDTQVKRPTWGSLSTVANGIEVRWNKPSKEHVKGYHVYRSVDGKKYIKLTSSLVTEERFLDMFTQSGHSYSYKIRAYDNVGNRSDLSQARKIEL